VLVLALLYLCIVVGLYGIDFWMPQVIQTFGLTPLEIGFLTAVPYLFASLAMGIWGWHSDLTGERIWHVALPLFLAGAAFAWSAAGLPLAVIMVALTLAAVGIYAAVSTFWSLPTAILTGTGAAAGLALVNSVGNLGGLAGPSIVGVIRQETGSFTAALLFLAAVVAFGGVIALQRRVRVRKHPASFPRPANKPNPVRRRARELVCALLRPSRLACPSFLASRQSYLASVRPSQRRGQCRRPSTERSHRRRHRW
jgi:ACS family tartrate transporter-like MFS transporter